MYDVGENEFRREKYIQLHSATYLSKSEYDFAPRKKGNYLAPTIVRCSQLPTMKKKSIKIFNCLFQFCNFTVHEGGRVEHSCIHNTIFSMVVDMEVSKLNW